MNRKYTSLPFVEEDVEYGHYEEARDPIVMIVLHSSASTRQGLINTFAGGTRMVSAHYGIDNDGSLIAFLEEYYTAYHAGNLAVNYKSIGIEHIDNAVKLHSDQQYETSIKLVADICKFYSIPCDTAHVVPHSSIVATSCPNGLDVNRIITGANKLLNGTPTPPANFNTQKAGQFDLTVNTLYDSKLVTTSNSDTLINGEVPKVVKDLIDNTTSLNTEVEDLTQKLSVCDVNYKTLQGALDTLKTDSDAKIAESQASLLTCINKKPIVNTVEVPVVKTYKTKLGKTFYKLAEQFG